MSDVAAWMEPLVQEASLANEKHHGMLGLFLGKARP